MNTKEAKKLYEAVLNNRNKQILKWLEQGLNQPQIAEKLGITRQRVFQIIKQLKQND